MEIQNYHDWIIERQHLLKRIKELEDENAELKKRLGEDVVPVVQEPTAMRRLSLQEKVDLFRSLFKGREDVFARRWYSRASGKSGYQPVCKNEWSQPCRERSHKCDDCPNRQFLPINNVDLYRHLSGKDAEGKDVIGLYVLKEDNTCHLLCADFDDKNCEHGFQNDVLAYVGVCKTAKGQLIFTTHESGLLDQDIFRPDEIWFAQKDAEQATQLYPLSDFNIHKTANIKNGYLNGRYGGI